MAHDLVALLERARRALSPVARKATPPPPSLVERARAARDRLRGVALVTKGAWSTAEVNDLPDSAFLHVETGGSKDAEGKTVPRSLRHFPVRDKNGKLDLPHLENAIAQAPKSDLPQTVIDRVQAEGRKLMEKANEAKKDAVVTSDLGPGVSPPQIVTERPMLQGTRQAIQMGYLEVGEDGRPRPSKTLRERVAQKSEEDGPPSSLPAKLIDFGGIPVLVDRPKGFVQTKLGPDGAVLWTRTYLVDYGGLAGTDGGDHELLDIFCKDPKSRTVWVAVQVNDAGEFDEYKLIAVETEEEARAIYTAHIPERYLASLSPMPTERLRALLGLPVLSTDAMNKSAPSSRARLERCAKAIVGATRYDGPTLPIDSAPAPLREQVANAPLTWSYPIPGAVGGWLGAIEPDDESWVAFVAVDGKVLAWASRDDSGGVRGEPFLAWRHDLAPARVELVASTKAATADEQYIFGIVLKPERTDLEGEIYAASVVRKTAHDWMAFFGNTDVQHKAFINDAVDPVESTIEKVAFWMSRDGEAYPADPATGEVIGAPAGAQLRFVPKGSWTVAHHIKDADLWAAIKAGTLTGYSINGLKKLAPSVAAPPAAP